jgi:hypothetical protein
MSDACHRHVLAGRPGAGPASRHAIPRIALLGVICLPGFAQDAAPLPDRDWQEALTAIRQAALDRDASEDQRALALTAYVKLLARRKQLDQASRFCQDVLKSAEKKSVIEAAVRAGCFLERERHGHLRAESDFLASCSEGAARECATALRQKTDQAVQVLSSLTVKATAPGPVALRPPPGQFGDRPDVRSVPELPAGALRVVLPRIQPPPWYDRLSFPLLKEPKK